MFWDALILMITNAAVVVSIFRPSVFYLKVIVNQKNFFSDLGSPICVVYGTKKDFSILTPFNPFFAILCFSDLPVTFPDLPLTFPDLPVTFLNLFLGASYLYTM